ncbi:hypothetical protein RQP46_003207 [Phenoliferia psychrophenolica]
MQPVVWNGPVTEDTKLVVIFIHGKGSNAREDLPVFQPIFRNVCGPGGVSRVVGIGLDAQDESWLPNRWDAPLASQEPYLSSALGLLHSTITSLPVPTFRIVILGFSQGCAMALTYALQHSTRFGGIVALAGSIIGKSEDWTKGTTHSLDGTPIYLSWGSADPYYNNERTETDVKALEERGGRVTLELFPQMGHFVTPRQLERLEDALRVVLDRDELAAEMAPEVV